MVPPVIYITMVNPTFNDVSINSHDRYKSANVILIIFLTFESSKKDILILILNLCGVSEYKIYCSDTVPVS